MSEALAEWARPIPMGNAYSVEATANDALSATRLALVELAERINTEVVTSVSVHTVLIDPANDQPWEATAYAALAE
mgnify:CR=1 FL=1